MGTFVHRITEHDDKSDFFHSSAYAKSQNQTSIGAASSETFAARRQLDNSRRFVGNYQRSQIVSSGNTYERAKTYDPAAARASAPQAAGQRPQPMASRPAMSRPPMPKNPGINPGIHR